MMFEGNHGPDWIPEMGGPFADEAAAYIRHKRAQGHQYAEPACFMLKSMDRLFGEMDCDGTQITQEMIDAYCSIKPGQSQATLNRKRTLINGFAKYLISKGWEDVATCDESRGFRSAFVPYIFGRDEIGRIFRVASALAKGERAHSFYTAICLCYTCGLRRSEAANLRVGDFDPSKRTVVIEHSKNDVSRQVAMSNSTAKVVVFHMTMIPDAEPERMLLRGRTGLPTWSHGLYTLWHTVLDGAGVKPRADGNRQRIHDLRHSFCVHTLENMALGGRDIRATLPLLSTYLGHKGITETEYYLRLVEPAYREVSNTAACNLPDFYGRGNNGDA
jgi:integrase